MDQHRLLSIGPQITSDMAFINMFHERELIDGGTYSRDDECGF